MCNWKGKEQAWIYQRRSNCYYWKFKPHQDMCIHSHKQAVQEATWLNIDGYIEVDNNLEDLKPMIHGE